MTVEAANVDSITAGASSPLPDARQSLGPALLEDLFPEGPAFRRSLQTYIVLLALAALIASFGLYQDSTAAIIGAMVVAPLGGAIMALAGALVTGRIRWQWITFLQVSLGAVMVVGLAYLVSLVIPDPLALTPSLEARTSPGLLDLGVALAAGAAGAWVAARRTGTDALPGVAIAVSLVPPLATVGICLELGRLDDAAGALLLFLTNLCAILVVASIVFLLAGARPDPAAIRGRRQLGLGLAIAVGALLLTAVPLAWNAQGVITNTVRAAEGAPVVEAWLGPASAELASWSVEGDKVSLLIRGPDAPPPSGELATALARTFGAPVELTVQYVPSTVDVVTASPVR